MENKVLLKNIGHIANYDKSLCDKILMFDNKKSNISPVQNENGEYNILFNNTLLHSEFGAVEEAQNIVTKLEDIDNSNSIRIIYGLGLGYLVDSMAQTIKKAKIIVYEPNLELLNLVLSIANIDALFEQNVILCSDKDKLSDYVKIYSNTDTKITVSFLSSYKKLFEDDIKDIVSIAQKAQGAHSAYKNTLTLKAPYAVYNTLYNIGKISKNPSINALKDIYKEKCAIVLSSGPSLKKNIEIIKNNQDKFVIFAVNTTIKLLNENNIKPDFIVNVETVNTTSHLEGINPNEHYFICEAFANCAFFNLETRKTFNYISAGNFLNDWLRNSLKLNDGLETIGTVSYSAFMSAYLMGFEKIILVGQDLAYQDGKCYAKNSQYEQLECVYDEKLKKYVIKVEDFEKFAASLLKTCLTIERARLSAQNILNFYNDNIYTTKSQDGKDIPTQTGFALFIDYFEKAAKQVKKDSPNILLYNCSTGGAQINGFENKNLSELVENLNPVEKINLDNFSANYDLEYLKQRTEQLRLKLLDLYVLFKDEVVLERKILNELKIKKTITSNIEKLFKKHKENLSKIISQRKDEHIGLITTSLLLKFIEKIDKDYLNDYNCALETIGELEAIIEWGRVYLKNCYTALCNSQSVILK